MKRAWAVAFGLLAVLFLSSCGGGGGDTLSYTGLTTPATIDNTNAESIALAAWYGGEMSDVSFLPTLAAEGGTVGGFSPFRVVPLIQTIRKLAGFIGGQGVSESPGQAAPTEIHPFDGRLYPPSPLGSGYVDVNGSWDDQTGRLSGSFSFHDYDDGSGVVLSGGIRFVGTTFDFFAPEPTFLEFTISTNSFSITDGIDTVRIGGTMAFQFNVPTNGPVVAVLNLVTLDVGTEKTVWLKDYTVTVTEDPSFPPLYSDIEISGRIYLHDYGYVDIETLAPFRVYETDLYPSSGDLVVTGKAIGGGYCKARLYVFDNTSYAVQIDADGDDIYEETIPGAW